MTEKELTAYLAELGKIEFTETEIDAMTEDMKNIITLMDKVREFDTDEKLYTLNATVCADLRADEIAEPYLNMEHYNHFTVTKVV